MGDKHQWTTEQLKCLLEVSIDEVNSVGKRGLSLYKDSWSKVAKALKEKFGIDLTQKQLKNAYDNLKAKYQGWVYLKNKTGNIYNAQTNTFTLTNEEWEDFKKGHPKAASLKAVPLPFPELCAQLFDGSTATGGGKWTSTQTSVAGSSSRQHVQRLMLTDTNLHDTEDDAGTYHSSFEASPEPATDAPFEPASEPTPEPNLKKRAKTSKSTTNDDDLAQEMRKALKFMMNGKEGATIHDCCEKLKVLGLEPVDPLFLAAYNIFGSSDMREIWMALPSVPEALKGWIEMTARSTGLIK